WLAALMFAALFPSVPGLAARRAAPWLAAFCVVRLLAAAQELVGPAASERARGFAAVLGGMLLWEFARRTWNERAPRRISAVTHVLALEALLLTGAEMLATHAAPAAGLLPL